jgi:peptidoglycan/LPS O-acetylase OafA/YrhL
VTAVGPGGRRTRADIQALRGFAVLGVILYHAGLGIAPSGYLGVDVFFVVSGYLISGIVMRQRSERRFRLADFYLRRIRRLIPASHAVLLATTIAAIGLLTATSYARFWSQLIGALSFSTNVALWKQINYFNDSAAFEPLLHMWSLAIEEQYYLILPIALMLVPKRMWLAMFVLVTIASLAGYGWLYPLSPGASFYLLPMRAWEIGLGSIAACLAGREQAPRSAQVLLRRLMPVAVPVLLVVPFVVVPAHLAYLLALPACLATLVVVGADDPRVASTRLLHPFAFVGDRSYALYLVHWPLFAFADTLYLGMPLPAWLAVALIGLGFAIALPLYACIEEPARRMVIGSRRLALLALASTVLLFAVGAGGLALKRADAPAIDLRGVEGLGRPGCDADAASFDGRCATDAAPQLLVWGDSFSQHLIPAIRATTTRPIAQASAGGCPPLLGVAPVDLQTSRALARRCLSFNDSVIAYLARTPGIAVVALSGRYLRYTQPGTRALQRGPAGETLAPIGFDALVAAQARTAAVVRALGKRVILISAVPQAGFDVGQCWERRLGGLPSVAVAPDCAIVAANAHPRFVWTARLMDAFARGGTPVVRLDHAMCGPRGCATAWGGVPLYRDASHMSATGSALVGRRLALGDTLWRAAR